MAALVQRYLDGILAEHAGVSHGALASYIPELAEVDPTGFGLALSSSDGYVYESGDADVQFTMQSISKPFTYALALDQLGQTDVDARIGVEPSGEGFNKISVDQVTNVPKNPMINAGAIVACSLIPGKTIEDRFDLVRDFFSACAGRSLTSTRPCTSPSGRAAAATAGSLICWRVSAPWVRTPTMRWISTSASVR